MGLDSASPISLCRAPLTTCCDARNGWPAYLSQASRLLPTFDIFLKTRGTEGGIATGQRLEYGAKVYLENFTSVKYSVFNSDTDIGATLNPRHRVR